MVIDRYYIENFLDKHAGDVKGRVLEMGSDDYTRQFGGPKVLKSDILDVSKGNLRATIIGDLTAADHIPSDLFDCAIVTQTLQMIFDIQAAVKHLHRILKPGGVLLVTSAGTSKVWRFEDVDPWGEYWRLTSQSAQRLFSDRFGAENVKVESYGNILTSVGFLHGLAREELTRRELDHYDPRYEVIVGVRAVKAG
jgi:SAM-dependent methyltransferase